MNSDLYPLRDMLNRIAPARSESDSAYFQELMLLGEYVGKILVAGTLAAIEDDRERSRYRLLHRLVRAAGIGDWSTMFDEAITGPVSQLFVPEARDLRNEMNHKADPSSWQHHSIRLLHGCLRDIGCDVEAFPLKVEGRRWLSFFSQLRNKSPRGHGAMSSATQAQLASPLEESIALIIDNARVFSLPWAYLRRNLSGKYRVVCLSANGTAFDYLKSDPSHRLADGVYLMLDRPRPVALTAAPSDATDFFVSNGDFNERDRTAEYQSYVTGDRLRLDTSEYMTPPGALPASHTEGLPELDVVGTVFTNIPPLIADYVSRPGPEQELRERLLNDRNPTITLSGIGGVGKTSLALAVLRDVATRDRFQLILWFSARDVDLLPDRPRQVQPQVITFNEMAEEFCRLVPPVSGSPVDTMRRALTRLDHGPTLFVFDNFETVRSPLDTFHEIDTYVRLPNKVLITTRHREFNGDFQIPLRGMESDEFDELVTRHAAHLGIGQLLTAEYRRELFEESAGHPYVAKVLLGEVARAGHLRKIERLLATRDDILTALFERTFHELTPGGTPSILDPLWLALRNSGSGVGSRHNEPCYREN